MDVNGLKNDLFQIKNATENIEKLLDAMQPPTQGSVPVKAPDPDLAVPEVPYDHLLNLNRKVLHEHGEHHPSYLTPWHIGNLYPVNIAQRLIARGGVGGDGGAYNHGTLSLAQWIQKAMKTLMGLEPDVYQGIRVLGGIYQVHGVTVNCSRRLRDGVPAWRIKPSITLIP